MAAAATGRALDRYVLFDEIAAGGMATVHFGRLHGSVGFARIVAIKRLHPMYAKDPSFVAMFTDEARLAARIRHSNVVATLDVVSDGSELFVVMEYVHGESLARLLRAVSIRKEKVPVPIAAAIVAGALHGLHAAHEATTETGEPLNLVHRDVSPQNVLVGVDGVARVLDFGIAKAIGRIHTTQNGDVRGKTAYMAPEQLYGKKADVRVDLYAAAVVLWETLTGKRLFCGETSGAIVSEVLHAVVDPPSRHAPGIPPELDAIVLRGLERDPSLRFASASEMAEAIERAVPLASAREVGAWVTAAASDTLTARARTLQAVERATPREPSSPEPSTSAPIVVTSPTSSTSNAVVPMTAPSTAGVVVPPPRSDRRWGTIALIAVTAIASAAAAATFVATRVGASDRAAAGAPPMAEVTVASATESAATTPPEPPAATAQTEPAPSAPPTPSSAEPPPAPTTETATPRTAKPTRGKRAPNCDPPYTVDPDGIHVPKPGCG